MKKICPTHTLLARSFSLTYDEKMCFVYTAKNFPVFIVTQLVLKNLTKLW